MSYNPNNPNGQDTMANSSPVVIASNQSAVPINGTITSSISGTIPTTVVSGTISTVTNAVSVSGTIPVSGTVTANAGTGTLATSIVGTVPVSGTFWQATQPVSGTVTAAISGTSTVSGTVTANAGTNLNTSALATEAGAVSTISTNTTNIPNVIGTAASAIPSKILQVGGSDGTLSRAIKTLTSGQMDIRPLTSADIVTSTISGTVPATISGTIPVSGTFWQTTQPVSGTITANAGTGTLSTSIVGGTISTVTNAVSVSGTVPVSGTFWQTTQPVSGTLTSSISGTVPVSGTFWQTTQPVSGTITANAGTGTLSTSIVGGTISTVTNAVSVSGTIPVSGTVTANAGTGTLSTSIVNTTVATTAPTLTKGTQGANGWSVQNLKDAGRNTRIFALDAYTAAPVAEAVQSVVQWYSNAAVAGTTQPAVIPAGKTLRLTHYTMSTKSLATVGSAVVRIRANTAGLGVLGSPLVFSMECGSRAGATTVAMTGGMDTFSGVFPDGLEFPAGTGLAFSMAGYGPAGVLTLEGVTRFQVFGYEY